MPFLWISKWKAVWECALTASRYRGRLDSLASWWVVIGLVNPKEALKGHQTYFQNVAKLNFVRFLKRREWQWSLSYLSDILKATEIECAYWWDVQHGYRHASDLTKPSDYAYSDSAPIRRGIYLRCERHLRLPYAIFPNQKTPLPKKQEKKKKPTQWISTHENRAVLLCTVRKR